AKGLSSMRVESTTMPLCKIGDWNAEDDGE
ncbi:hypothetical protein Tco_0574666, partial [Tanacetum coccineum]